RCVKKYTPGAPAASRNAGRIFCTPGFLRSTLAMASVRSLFGGDRAADLELHDVLVARLAALGDRQLDVREQRRALDARHEVGDDEVRIRSEERRVGKEWRSRGTRCGWKKMR